MIFVTAPIYFEVVQYDPRDSASHAEIIRIVGGARLQWLTHWGLRVHVGEGDEAAWVTANSGDWVGQCDVGCAHILPDADIRDTAMYRRVHQP